MGVIYYDVPLVNQRQSPICWVCCMAMIAAEREGHSPTVSKYLNGFNPDNASVSNPAADWDDFQRRLARCGFSSTTIDASIGSISSFLSRNGPFILTHHCYGFNYGAGWKMRTKPDEVHAVVINSADPDSTMCTMNNPWGNKDRFLAVSNVINAIIEYKTIGPNIAYYTG
ncbi:papain-like cysteine protease family protein [Methylobacterium trifolii]|uniref:Peptidase C39-like domain-containing protein n=1 Tax=Methylobacterium trifolii TaxID=1003092 RepID=A0ABQ4U7B3_9HYPH|nr:papain-like cysteine protease family protein [Methylobacterium trifolii]GJE62772.1 hypothetical protein MPOCJGCO_4908 [Methylobacterium trifolii]